ncbi:MAG: hypothetical protein SGI73_10985 [Chloroflexota bacterium]|nr:hypothetical protein [Chloroflexota bacterium]
MITRRALTLLYVLIAMIPIALTLILLVGGLGVRLADYQPIWVDELVYWHESATFDAVGFDGGYYTSGETPARASFTHFGAHGFGFAALMGGLARPFAWSYHTVPILNAFMLSAALALYLGVTRPRGVALWIAAAAIAAWYPLTLYLALTMQETFHHAVAAVLAAGFAILLRAEPSPRARHSVIVVEIVVLVIASLVRVTWSLAFFPLFLLAVPAAPDGYGQRRRWFSAFVIAFGIVAVSAGVYLWTTGVYSGGFLGVWTRELGRARFFGVSLIANNMLNNLALLVRGNPLEIVLRAQLIALGALSLISLVQAGRTHGRRGILPARDAALFAFLLGTVLILQSALYDVFDWRDYRVFAPLVFLGLLVLIARGRWRIAGLLLALNLLALPSYWGVFNNFHLPKYTFERTRIAAFGDATAAGIVYEADAPSAWCNTLLTSFYTPELLALPPGIGFASSDGIRNTDAPLRSRYLLLRDDDWTWAQRTTRMEWLTETAIGAIYLNLDADC